MADIINFTLPSFNNSTTDGDVKQIKSYLYTLTEQMKFYLNNIDADNYNEEYQKKMAALIDTSRTNSIKANIVQDTMRKIKNEYDNALNEAVGKISGNLGGYIVTLDINDDGYPDDLRILVDTYDYKTATKYWQFNRAGLAFIEKNGSELISHLALTDDGFIAADRIKGVIGDFVTLNACTLNACVGNFSGSITATDGYIANWQIRNDTIFSRVTDEDDETVCYEVKIKNDFSNDRGKKAFYINRFTNNKNSDNINKSEGEEALYKTEVFYIRRNGEFYTNKGIIDDLIMNNHIYLNGSQRGLRYANISEKYWVYSSYNLIMYSESGNVVIGDSSLSGNVNLYTSDEINLCISGYSKRINIATYSHSVGGKTIGEFITLTPSKGLWFDVNNGNSDMSINVHNLRLYSKGITTTGNLYLNSDGIVITSSSAARLKENITDKIDSDIDPMKLLDACVKQFNYKAEYKDSVIFAGKQIGFIADELEKVYPSACLYNSNGEVDNWNDRIIITSLVYIVQKIYNELKEIKNEN